MAYQHNIPAYTYVRSAFTGWTDGPKWVLDTGSEVVDIPAEVLRIYANIDVCKQLLANGLAKSGAIYIYCTVREFIQLVQEFPMYTLYLLVSE